jgi:outer membrane protein assembly factor BamB
MTTRPIRAALVAWILSAAAVPSAAADAPAPPVAWRHAAGGWGEPTVDAGEAYYLGRDHEIIAVNASTGRLRWRVGTGGVGDAPLGSAIRVTESLVIAADGGIVAVDRVDGRPAWRFAPDGDAPGPYLGGTAHSHVYAGSLSGRLYALDATTGRLRWTARPAGRRPALVFAPVVAGDRVVVAFAERAASGVSVFDPKGRRLWRRQLPRAVASTGPAAVVGDVVIVAGSDGTLQAWDLRTGRPRWRAAGVRTPAGPGPSLDIRPLVAADTRVVAGSSTGRLTAYDARTGIEAWSYTPPEDMAVLRLRANASTVFAPYTDDSIHAIDAATGRMRWRAGGIDLRVEWPPAVADGYVFAAGIDTLVAWRDLAVAVPSDDVR